MAEKSLERDLELVKQHWEKEETVSLKDKNLQLLEREAITKFLATIKPNTLIDIGCGDCENTIYFSEFANTVFAFDYSDAMLKKAKRNIGEGSKIQIGKLDIRDDIPEKADVIVTTRLLINLGNFENQKAAIEKIHEALNENGYYIMLECCKEGLFNLNSFRALLQMEPLLEPFHNIYFDIADLIKFLGTKFSVEKVENFSTYYFLTRVYNQLLEPENFAKYDHISRVVSDSKVDLFGSNIIGPQFLIVLRKK